VLLERSLMTTAENLGQDGRNYYRLMRPLVRNWDKLLPEISARCISRNTR